MIILFANKHIFISYRHSDFGFGQSYGPDLAMILIYTYLYTCRDLECKHVLHSKYPPVEREGNFVLNSKVFVGDYKSPHPA